MDQADVAVASSDPMAHLMQDIKGVKVLATPAVRRLAIEHKVGIVPGCEEFLPLSAI